MHSHVKVKISMIMILVFLLTPILMGITNVKAEDTPPPDFPRDSFREFLDQGDNTTAIGVTYRDDSITISTYFSNDSVNYYIPVLYVRMLKSYVVPVYRTQESGIHIPFIINGTTYDLCDISTILPVRYNGSNISFNVRSIVYDSNNTENPIFNIHHDIDYCSWKRGTNLATVLLERWNSNGHYYVMPISLDSSQPSIPLKKVPRVLLISNNEALISKFILRIFPDIEDGDIVIIFNNRNAKQKDIIEGRGKYER